MTGDLWRLQ